MATDGADDENFGTISTVRLEKDLFQITVRGGGSEKLAQLMAMYGTLSAVMHQTMGPAYDNYTPHDIMDALQDHYDMKQAGLSYKREPLQ